MSHKIVFKLLDTKIESRVIIVDILKAFFFGYLSTVKVTVPQINFKRWFPIESGCSVKFQDAVYYIHPR